MSVDRLCEEKDSGYIGMEEKTDIVFSVKQGIPGERKVSGYFLCGNFVTPIKIGKILRKYLLL
ncbi:hypothetical protein C819_03744 [Lachnospiraceae bacterium 10-1]|jgi:hypothetical protein|nr:hypothetical protein C819_03744 [Lachnospiraceae bacterium 10-1]